MSDERPPDDSHEGDDVRDARDRDRTTDAVDRDDHDIDETAAGRDEEVGESPDEPRGEPAPEASGRTEAGGGGLSDRVAFWISALIGLVLAVGAVGLVSARAPFFENILRIRPSVEGGGIGADWLVGNTEPALELLIAIVHFADVLMGIFILLMVFIHWAAFRRLGARMRPPAGSARGRESAAATDGGEPSAARRSSSDRRSDGGARTESDAANSGPDGDPTGADGGDPS